MAGSFRNVVEAVSEVLLDRGADTDALAAACAALHGAALEQVGSLPEGSSLLPGGKAISPADAARCLLDPRRTAILVRGAQAAIERVHARNPNSTVRVLYAGCGPFAPLLLTLAPRHAPEALQITLVDVHGESLTMARRLFALAGVADRLARAHCADAATLALQPDEAADVLVVEVLQAALQHEPQVAVLTNLARQCAATLQIVPAGIRVCAWLGEPSAAWPRMLHLHLGTVLELTRHTLEAFVPACRQATASVPLTTLQVAHDAPAGLHLSLSTRIDNGAGETLAGPDSGLTLPVTLFGLGTIAPGDRLDVSYRLATDPGFEVRRITR